MRCQYNTCYLTVSKPGLCYYHEKLLAGLFDPSVYDFRRQQALDWYIRNGGLTRKPFKGWELLCPTKSQKHLKNLEKRLETLANSDLAHRITLRKLRSNVTVTTHSEEG